MRLKHFLSFMVIWVFACYLADYVFKIESSAWAMAWGFSVGYSFFSLSGMEENDNG